MDAINVLFVWILYRHYLQRQRQVKAKRQKPIIWMKDFLTKRKQEGQFYTLLRHLRDPTAVGHAMEFQNYMRMDCDLFEELLNIVGPLIERRDTVFRDCVSAGERLAITLRFLATGDSYPSLQAAYRVSRHTIAKIIPDTLMALKECLDEYIVCPELEAEWKDVAARFGERWNLAHCLGAIDGKHIRIRAPAKSGSTYFNYKKYFSIILLAVVDADYRFRYIEVGCEGKAADSGIFNVSALIGALETGTANIPPDDCLPYDTQPTPYYLVGDDAFAMKTWLMKPYPYVDYPCPNRIYNYRLSRARRCVECSFGILANR